MANICTNMFYTSSDDIRNLECIEHFFDENFSFYNGYTDGEYLEFQFDSKWIFPEEKMKELFSLIPNKEDIYMRCLSYEFGQLYHALWICNEDGWTEV